LTFWLFEKAIFVVESSQSKLKLTKMN